MRTGPRTLLALFTVLFVGSTAPPAAARTWHVFIDGSGDAPTIQACIDSAAAGDTVLLHDGTYTGAGNRDLDFGGKGIVVRSAGGDPEACVIDCEGTPENPHRGFWFRSGEDSTAVLEGIKITHGAAYGTGGEKNGGGIRIESTGWTHPTIRGCVLEANRAQQDGGGLYATRTYSSLASCRFLDNEAGGFGGGLYGRDASFREVDHCGFRENVAGHGGGLFTYDSGVPFRNCLFEGNQATSWGGGADCGGVAGFIPSFYRCVFQGNSAGSGGGGLSLSHWEYVSGWTSSYIQGCSFLENTSPDGAAIWLNLSYTEDWPTAPGLKIDSCTIAGNIGEPAAVVVWATHTWVEFGNTIVAFQESGKAIEVTDDCPLLWCSDLYGNEGGNWTGCLAPQRGIRGNFTADPLYCDPQAGDYALEACSPCLNAPGCGLVGAYGEGCDIYTGIAVDPTDGAAGLDERALRIAPNPSCGAFTIEYGMAPGAPGVLHVYDIAGRLVRAIEAPASRGTALWDGKDAAGRDAAPGVYFVRPSSGVTTDTRRVILVR